MKKIKYYFFFTLFLLLFLSCRNSEQVNTIGITALSIDTIYHSEKSTSSNAETKDYDDSIFENQWSEDIKDLEVVNGTWVSREELLNSSRVADDIYSWGIGKTIVDSSMDIDLGERDVRIPGEGLYRISNAYKNENETINLKLFYIGDRGRNFPLYMELSFLDNQKVIVICYPEREWFPRSLSETPWIWHRLSGPQDVD